MASRMVRLELMPAYSAAPRLVPTAFSSKPCRVRLMKNCITNTAMMARIKPRGTTVFMPKISTSCMVSRAAALTVSDCRVMGLTKNVRMKKLMTYWKM